LKLGKPTTFCTLIQTFLSKNSSAEQPIFLGQTGSSAAYFEDSCLRFSGTSSKAIARMENFFILPFLVRKFYYIEKFMRTPADANQINPEASRLSQTGDP
jgi:hypothetical protein